MLAIKPAPMTADRFLEEYEGAEGKWELVDGVPLMMSGGSIVHAFVAMNILTSLRTRLRGSGCLPLGSDAGFKIGEYDVRYPDVAIYCDPRDLALDRVRTKAFQHPCVVFEVLSPSTSRYDRGRKAQDYNGAASMQLLVLVDPVAQVFETYERVDIGAWAVNRHPSGSNLAIIDPAVTLTAHDIFAND